VVVSVTGGTGFVGAGLVRAHLLRGDEVRVLTRRVAAPTLAGACLVRGDLTTGRVPHDFLKNADILYHCAGEIRDQAQMHALHVDGTRVLLERAAGRVGRWVQLSSVGVYGPRRAGMVTEDTPEAPVGPYEETKALSDRIVTDAHRTGLVDVVVLRPSIVFGPGMPNRSLFALIAAVNRGVFFYVGPKDASANYIPVDNVVDALMLCGTSDAASGRVFNLSAWRKLEDFIETIAIALTKTPPRLRLPRRLVRSVASLMSALPQWPLTVSRVDSLSTRVVYSTARIESQLGYRPRVTVEDELHRTVGYWQQERGRA
jgi:nucleoside-diphosphate-sugar epimerase